MRRLLLLSGSIMLMAAAKPRVATAASRFECPDVSCRSDDDCLDAGGCIQCDFSVIHDDGTHACS